MDVVKGPDNQNEQAFIALVENYQHSLLRISYFYLKDRTLAEDAVQETFIKAYKNLPLFRGECSEKTWLTHILINTCRDMNRSAWLTHLNRQVQPEDVKAAVSPPQEENTALSDALWHLPRKYREVILLYYYQDMSMQEIAQALHTSVSTVSRRIRTACSRLYSDMRKEGAPWMKSV